MGIYDDDPVWDALFVQSQDMLVRMADEALVEAKAGLTQPMFYDCPVCDYPGFDENPLDHTYDICPQCGVEFGYDDAGTAHRVLRARWERAGKPFWQGQSAEWMAWYDRVLHPVCPSLRVRFWNFLIDIAYQTNNDQLFVWAMRHRG